MNVYELMLWVSVVFLAGCVIEFFYSVFVRSTKASVKLDELQKKVDKLKKIYP